MVSNLMTNFILMDSHISDAIKLLINMPLNICCLLRLFTFQTIKETLHENIPIARVVIRPRKPLHH